MFIKNLENAMERNKTNKSQLAHKTNISKSSFKKWENGSSPRFDTVIKIAEELNTSLNYLAYGEERENISELERKYNKASKEDRKVIDLILSKYDESGKSSTTKIG